MDSNRIINNYKLSRRLFLLSSSSAGLLLLTGCSAGSGDGSDGSDTGSTQASIRTPPQDISVIEGSDATFSVDAIGSNLTYEWARNGVSIPNSNSPSITASSVNLSHDGDVFQVAVTGSNITLRSAPATLTVTPAPASISIDSTLITIDTTSITVDRV